tara:strand:+ start:236 stop:1483 length:1248 start_codon:yes stop_codon:yes gene_type:complete
MHHEFAGRNWRSGNFIFSWEPAAVDLWKRIDDCLNASTMDPCEISRLIIPLAEKHPHSLGWASPRLLSKVAWNHLKPSSRGIAFAAATQGLNDYLWEKVLPFLKQMHESELEIDFDSEAATEATCNLIASNLLDEFSTPFDSISNWGDAQIERLDYRGNAEDPDWKDDLAPLSRLSIDRCLEGAVRMGNISAAQRCLAAGANPDIGVWKLERSCNERLSALGYALESIGERPAGAEMAETLLDGGANARGTEYGGYNKPLFLALYKKQWNLADRLLDEGAGFDGGSPAPGQAKSKRENRWLYFDYELSRDKLNWIHENMGPVVTLCDIGQQVCFHSAHGHGGNHYSFLSVLLSGDQIPRLEHFEERGLPLTPSAVDLMKLIQSGDDTMLTYLFKRLEAGPAAAEKVSEFRNLFSG